MARTEVQEASDAVLAAADELLVEAERGFYDVGALLLAVRGRRAAIARQDVKEKSVYLRSDATESEKQAARAAMISRPGWRKCIYDLLLTRPLFGLSDREIEEICENRRGQTLDFKLGDVEIPDRRISHQSLSSARKSLVDAGLVYAFGAEIHEGRRHIRWRARPLNG